MYLPLKNKNKPLILFSITKKELHFHASNVRLIYNFTIFLTDKNVLRVHCDLNQPPSQQLTQQHLTQQLSQTNISQQQPLLQQHQQSRSSPPGTLSTSCSLQSTGNGNNNFVSEAGRFRLNANMLSSLSKLLDPPTAEGHDWRLLAERLNVHRYVTFFATRPSPTEAILHLWEARNREILAVSNLTNILRGMGRFDAAAVIEQQIHWKEPKLH